jgi:hypothetical protein
MPRRPKFHVTLTCVFFNNLPLFVMMKWSMGLFSVHIFFICMIPICKLPSDSRTRRCGRTMDGSSQSRTTSRARHCRITDLAQTRILYRNLTHELNRTLFAKTFVLGLNKTLSRVPSKPVKALILAPRAVWSLGFTITWDRPSAALGFGFAPKRPRLYV